jgi:hypothetical protein
MENEHGTKKTQPIAIATASGIQYNLKHGLFDPIQNSPPSVWKARLMQRLNTATYTTPLMGQPQLKL